MRIFILSFLAFAFLCCSPDSLCQGRSSFNFNIGIFGEYAAPSSDDFDYHSKSGFGGGLVMSTTYKGYVIPTIFLSFVSFEEKQHGETDYFFYESEESNMIISSGFGLRFGNFESDLRFFGEFYLTINLVNFSSKLNYDKPREIGYIGRGFGVAAGAGLGYSPINLGYRWISAGGGNIQYHTLYIELVTSI